MALRTAAFREQSQRVHFKHGSGCGGETIASISAARCHLIRPSRRRPEIMLTKLRSDYPAVLKKTLARRLLVFSALVSVRRWTTVEVQRTDGVSDCGEPRARESPLLLRSMRRRRKERTPKNARCNAPNKTERKEGTRQSSNASVWPHRLCCWGPSSRWRLAKL